MRRLLLVVALAYQAPLAAQQLAPPGTGGVAAVDRLLAHLATNKRILMIAAHPDDESSELLSVASRGLGVEAAYLSLSRGEGGQNLIGTELGEGLGLVRTGELLAARSVDGARQYFTRDYDFGFSRSIEEADRFWPRDTSLADGIRIMRRFRPQVIVAIFSGTPRDGHGQHQQSGLVARQLFEMFKDSSWGPRRLYRSAAFDTMATTLRIPSGILDPVEGRSYVQIAVQSRSLHRSQDMGGIQRLGPSMVRLQLLATAEGGPPASNGPSAAAADALFAGADTTLAPGLARYRTLVDSARAILGPRSLDRVVALLVGALGELRRHGSAEFRARKEADLQEAIAAAAGIVVDPAADDGFVVAGQRLNVAFAIWNARGGAHRVTSAEIETPGGWSVAPGTAPPNAPPIPPGSGLEIRRYALTPPADAPLSEPYFLVRPRIGALYDWSLGPDSLLGEALDPPHLSARVTLEVGGVAITLRREVSWRFADQARGEIRRPVFVVPAVGVTVSPDVLVWPVQAGGARTIMVELAHGARGTTSGELRLDLPPGWPAVAPQRFALAGEGTRRSFSFEVHTPPRLAPGSYQIQAVATSGGQRYDRGTAVIDYPHIRPMQYTTRATVQVAAASLALPALRRVGYVRGASDLVPEALASVGVPIHVLSPTDLERADLSQYDVIVIGSRAYETEPALIANNGRLLDYARAGGRIIVQYQQYQFVQGSYAPFRLSIARPHDRVTDETAPMRLLEPDHPAFRTPNAIAASDWTGWVQERGLYFAHDWDPSYRPLLETGDNGDRLQGGLLVARLGRGLYVYTGLAFFRELPAGVPGAYRLFVNLLGMEPANVPQMHGCTDAQRHRKARSFPCICASVHLCIVHRLLRGQDPARHLLPARQLPAGPVRAPLRGPASRRGCPLAGHGLAGSAGPVARRADESAG